MDFIVVIHAQQRAPTSYFSNLGNILLNFSALLQGNRAP